MKSEMKKHRYVNSKNRCVISLAAILTGCMLWGGCSDPFASETAMQEKDTDVGGVTTAEKDTDMDGAVSKGENIEDGGTAPKEENIGEYRTIPKEENIGEDRTIPKEENNGEDRIVPGNTTQAASPLLEQLFSYEINKNFGDPYLTVTGIAEEYRDSFWENMADITRHSDKYGCMLIPTDVNGMPVRVIGEEAFADMDIKWLNLPDTLEVIEDGAFRNTGISRLELPENLERIGAGAFEGCGLECLQLPNGPLTIEERAFAGSQDLWTVLIPDGETILEDGVFADCREGFLLCYGNLTAGQENPVAAYARGQGLDSMEIILSREPIVNYPDQPLVLKPEIRNFFYGDYEDGEEELWCSWEEDENAPNFGYIDWQAPGCSSWCGAYGFELEVKASSELTSSDGRYNANNVRVQDRQGTWAEGTEGPGIGESLTYRQSCTYGIDNKWEALTYDNRNPELDGFMRYSEICIVNGYAKTPKAWEENGRVQKLLMYVEDRPYAWLELEDTILPQYFLLPEDDIKVLNGGMLEARFEIVEVYPGSLYEDTCLTGLVMEFTGRYAH